MQNFRHFSDKDYAQTCEGVKCELSSLIEKFLITLKFYSNGVLRKISCMSKKLIPRHLEYIEYNLFIIRVIYENKPWNTLQTELAGQMDTIVTDGKYSIKLIGKY